MTCKTVIASSTVQIIVCSGDMEMAWVLSMCGDMDAELAEHEHEMALADAEDFQHIEVEFCALREETDPYGPPTGTTSWYEEAERDPAITYSGDDSA